MTIRAYVDASTGQLHYREQGAGPPLVLLHKSPSSSIQYVRCLPLLAPHVRAIAMDTPGFGQSDPPPAPPEEMEVYARAVVDLLDALGLERASVLGHHTGASIALEVAAAYPERVDRLILAGLLALETEEERAQFREMEGRSRAKTLTDYPLAFARGFPGNVRRFIDLEDAEHVRLELIAHLQGGPRYPWAFDAVFRYRAFDRMPLVRAPTLFLCPDRDTIPAAITSKAQPHVPGSVYQTIPGDTEITFNDPRTFCDAVLRFLA